MYTLLLVSTGVCLVKSMYADGGHIVVYAGSVHMKMLFGVLGE